METKLRVAVETVVIAIGGAVVLLAAFASLHG